MFSLRDTLEHRQLPSGYNSNMGILMLCGPRPTSITVLRNLACPQSIVVHFKSLLPIAGLSLFIDTQFIAMQRLFAEGGIAVLRGTTEDLSANPDLMLLRNLDVGNCIRGQPTADQNELFDNRNNVPSNEIVVYIVSTLVGRRGNPVGCATHPDGRPGVAVVGINAKWLVAHEIGHVLGLKHAGSTQSDSLMFRTVSWTNVPPDLSDTEHATMLSSHLSRPC